MTACQEIQGSAAGLAALAADDPERQRAFAHARGCAACRAALAEGERLMPLIDAELGHMESPSAEVMARVSREILLEMAEVGGAGVDGVATAATVAVPKPARARGPWRPVAAVSAALLALWAVKVLPKHGLMLGAGARVSAALALLATAVSATVMVLGGATFATVPGASVVMAFVSGGGEGVQAAAGIKCALFELMFAAPPLVLAFVLARRGRFARPAIALAAGAAGGALIAQAVLHLACHAQPSTTHNLAFHTIPVLLVAGLGALVGRRIRPPVA